MATYNAGAPSSKPSSKRPTSSNKTSSGSSSGSSSKGSSGGSSYTPTGTHNDASVTSDKDLAGIQAAKDRWNEAYAKGDQAGMDAAHAQAEAIRNGYGYSGGKDGSQNIKTGSGQAAQTGITPTGTTQIGISGGSSGGGSRTQQAQQLLSNLDLSKLTTKDIEDIRTMAQGNSQFWHATDDAGKKDSEAANKLLNGYLKKQYDSASGTWSDTGETYALSSIAKGNETQTETERAMQYLTDAQSIKTQQTIDTLDAQKYGIRKSGEQLNAAAQDAYMQAVNPNGGMAEVLAAQGLLPTGLTESSLISSGNEYQNSLNENSRLVVEQLSAIERAIVQAQQNGDIAVAELLANYYQQAAALAQQNADRILSFGQWSQENSQNQAWNEKNYALTEQELAMKQQELNLALQQGRMTQEEHNMNMNLLEQQYQYNKSQM